MPPYRPIDRQLAAELTINWALSPRLSCWQCRNPNGMAIAVIALEQARYLTAMKRREFLKAATGFIASSTPDQLARSDLVEV